MKRIIDTNVLMVASSSDSRNLADHVPTEDREKVFDWARDFFNRSNAKVVLDFGREVMAEYRQNMDQQCYGLSAVQKCIDTGKCEYVQVENDASGFAELPPKLRSLVHDRSDRKFVALALKCGPGTAKIINATDTDWIEWEKGLFAEKVELEHLLEKWLIEMAAKKSKTGGKKKTLKSRKRAVGRK